MPNTQMKAIHTQEVLGKVFKVYGTKEEPMFLAKDVAEWIDYSYESKTKGIRKVSQMVNMVDEDEKVKAVYNVATTSEASDNVATTSRITQESWFLTEDGLYEVLMQSRKPIAKEFKKEVKGILKQMRKTGGAVVDINKFIENTFVSFSSEVKELLKKDFTKQIR